MACKEEKEFLTANPGEIVLDVRADNYSLNGRVLGRTASDFSDDDLLIEHFDKELKKAQENLGEEVLQMLTGVENPVKRQQIFNDYPLVKIHYDNNVTYDVFYKSYSTISFHFHSFQLAFGSNYKDICKLHKPHESYVLYSHVCKKMIDARISDRIFRTKQFRSMLMNHEITNDDLRWCAAADTALSLTVYRKDGKLAYLINWNENGQPDGYRMDSFPNDFCFCEFMGKMAGRRNRVTLRVLDDILLEDFAPVIKKLNQYGYMIEFKSLSH
ncbi:hypothetical protein [Fibrobacter sp.]|uniref:hypothetical protein n=1 Tax=Fibrobacter sp. TaxID=35828 RepID=UPI003864AFBC